MSLAPHKAYKNLEFLNSPAARHIRILCEYEEPRQRFLAEKVHDTIVVFGSARARPTAFAQDQVHHLERELARSTDEAERAKLERDLGLARGRLRLARYYDETVELSRRLTEWDMQRQGSRRYLICTGGGPGIMEAANRGASLVEGGRSVGLGISLPFEEKVNAFVPPELAFEFHYFFTRKYWFMYLAKALVLMPGGFGTLDELYESLTLRQTGKIKKPLPTVLYGKDYWDEIADIDAMVRWGTISDKDLQLFHRSDSVSDAFDYLVEAIEQIEREEISTGKRFRM
jgi:uncharacterized protein (TIGR00730 family)